MQRRSTGIFLLGSLLAIGSGCSNVPPPVASGAGNSRTFAAIGDRPIVVAGGEPGETLVQERANPPVRLDPSRQVVGRVIDSEGLPVARAEVRVAIDGDRLGRSAQTIADEAGRFTLDDLRPGSTYTLIAEWPDGRGGMTTGRTRISAPATDVVIALGEERNAAAPAGPPIERASSASTPSWADQDARVNIEDLPPAEAADELLGMQGASAARGVEAAADPDDWRRADEQPVVARPELTPNDSSFADTGEPAWAHSPPAAPAGRGLDDEGPNPLPPARDPLDAPLSRTPAASGSSQPAWAGSGVDTSGSGPEPASDPSALPEEPADESLIDQVLSASPEPPVPAAPGGPRTAAPPPPAFPDAEPLERRPPMAPVNPALAPGIEPLPTDTPASADVEAEPVPAEPLSPEPVPATETPADDAPAPTASDFADAAPQWPAPEESTGEVTPPAIEPIDHSSPPGLEPPGLTPMETDAPTPTAPEGFESSIEEDAAANQTADAQALQTAPVDSQHEGRAWTWGALAGATGSAAAAPAGPPPMALADASDTSCASLEPPALERAERAPPRRDLSIEPASCAFDPRRGRLVDFQVPTTAGQPLTMKGLDADYILLDFWASWCGPCLRTIPHLVELQEHYGDRLAIVGLAYEQGPFADQAATVEAVARRLGINYHLAVAQADGRACPIQTALNVRAFPTMILLDRNGNVLWRDQGGTPEVISRLNRVLAGGFNQLGNTRLR